MKVSDLLNTIRQSTGYVYNSLYLKSSDNYGCIYKYLIAGIFYANRKEIFIALNSEESELDLLDKTIITYIEVYPAM